MWPKSAQSVGAYGLLKTHKHYERLPNFRLIIDATNTPYYGVSKFLWNLLNPLKENESIVQDSFFAAKKIFKMPKELFEDGYRYVSFDIEPVLTSIPLSRNINIILARIYNQILIKAH